MDKIVLKQNRTGSRIMFQTPYTPDFNDLLSRLKKIPGAKFERDHKAWSFPRTWNTCLASRELANEMGWGVAIRDDKLKAWAESEASRQSNIVDLSDIHSVHDMPVIRNTNPNLWAAMESRPFQTAGATFIQQQRSVLLADDPGLGKTLQTLAAFEEAQVEGPILVVTNVSSQQITWPNELRRWAPDDEVVVFDTTIPAKNREAVIRSIFEKRPVDCARTWVLMNPYWVRMKADLDQYGKYVYSTTGVKMLQAEVPEIFKHYWAGVVADESHETLATNTGNGKKWSQQRLGMGALKVREDGLKISISGTPMRGKPENMFGQLNWLRPEEYTSFWNWAGEHFQIVSDSVRVKGGAVQETRQLGELLDEERFYKAMSTVLIRRSKGQVAVDLPPKLYGGAPHPSGDVIGVWLPMGKKQKKFYDKMVADSSLSDGDLELNAVGILAETTRLKQLATSCGELVEEQAPMWEVTKEGEFKKDKSGRKIPLVDEDGNRLFEDVVAIYPVLESNKFEWLINFLKERDLLGKGAKGTGKVIVASQFRKVIDLFRTELVMNHETDSYAITGATSVTQRKNFQKQFQDPNFDGPKIFFLQSVAGGTSLTLDQADDVVILDEMWNPDIQEQIEDRAHRLSRTDHNVTIWYLRSLDTIEEHIGITVDERNRICKGIMDGSRGIDFRKLLVGK